MVIRFLGAVSLNILWVNRDQDELFLLLLQIIKGPLSELDQTECVMQLNFM